MTTDPINAPAQDRGFLKWAAQGSLLAALAICVVVPHSFQIPTAIALGVAFVFCVLGLRSTRWLIWLIVIYCLGAILTVIYLFVGFLNGAPIDAILQSAAVYLVSPFLWIVLASSLMQYFGPEGTVKWLVRFTWLALLSIVLFFWAYFAFGRDSVKFLTEDANMNVRGGFAGTTMLVYGSLIFLAGGIFAEPGVLRSRLARLLMPAALIAAAATSGRSAFLIAIAVGFVIGLVLRPGLRETQQGSVNNLSLLNVIGALAAMVMGIVVLNALFAQLDLAYIVELFWTKLLSGGGNERIQQFYALWEGVEDGFGLGRGHGVGVDYLRSDEFPWRYELLPLATLFKVGVIGLAIYSLPFVLAASRIIKKFQDQSLTRVDIYMAGGLSAALLATFTNPYLESFVFQFMYFLPVVALGMSRPVVMSPPSSRPSNARERSHVLTDSVRSAPTAI